MVEVPVSVDEDLDGVGVDGGEGGGELGLAGGVAGVDEELALFGGEDGDVAAGSAEEGDVAAEWSGGNLVVGIRGAGSGEEVLRLRGWDLNGRGLLSPSCAGIEGCGGRRGCRGGEEVTAGDRGMRIGHEGRPVHR